MVPVDVAHAPAANTLTITWEDGQVSTYPVPVLRGWCPCANCQGHSSTTAYREAPGDVGIEAMWEVGAYAVQIRFSDGHDTGIFRWSYLWSIADEHPPLGPKRGRFVAGSYLP